MVKREKSGTTLLEKAGRKIGINFSNYAFLEEALTHRSYLNENRGIRKNHNERLEFLGDAVLELIVTEYLFANFPNPEGDLTNWRAALVNGEHLASVAKELGIEEFILMSKGEKKDTGKARMYILANAMEAIIGAIYLDQGYSVAKNFVAEKIIIHLKSILKSKSYLDAKSYFQEKAQEIFQITPHYELIKEWGPDHDKKFLVAVMLGEEKVAEGQGMSKQEAQRKAAQNGLKVKGWI